MILGAAFLLGAATFGAWQLSSTRLEVVEDLRIGSEAAPEYQFSAIPAAVVDARGDVYAVMARENEVRVFDATGRFVRRIGRRGKGPGEFTGPDAIGWHGDSLWVRDRGSLRLLVFGPGGREARTLPAFHRVLPALANRPAAAPVFIRALLRDGSLLAVAGQGAVLDEGYAMPDLVAATRDRTTPLLHLSSGMDSATPLHEMAPGRDWIVMRAFGDGGALSVGKGQPLSDLARWDVSSTGDVLVIVDETVATDVATANMRVAISSVDGRRTVRRLPYSPMPASRAFHDSIVDRVTPKPIDGRSPDRDAVRAALLLPVFRPAVTAVLAARDGRIWIRREFAYDAEVVWDVLDPSGLPIGHVRLPRDLRLLEADATHLWGVYPDDDDVPVLVRYAVQLPSSAR